MRIEELTLLAGLVQRVADAVGTASGKPPRGWFLSTDRNAIPARAAIDAGFADPFLLAIGPEGGWTADEQGMLSAAGLTPVGLTRTILRVETAAVAAAAIVATMTAGTVRPARRERWPLRPPERAVRNPPH